MKTIFANDEPSLPRVESRGAALTTAGSWKGRTLAEAIPTSIVKRIILDRESGFSGGRSLDNPMDHDSIFAHLYAAKQLLRGWGLDARETDVASFAVFTGDGQAFYWKIVSQDSGGTPSAVLIHGQEQSARIEITGFASAKAIK